MEKTSFFFAFNVSNVATSTWDRVLGRRRLQAWREMPFGAGGKRGRRAGQSRREVGQGRDSDQGGEGHEGGRGGGGGGEDGEERAGIESGEQLVDGAVGLSYSDSVSVFATGFK